MLTSVFSWRAVLLVNVPLLIITLILTLRSVQPDRVTREQKPHIDIEGAVLLCATLVGLVFGLSETQNDSFHSPAVLVPIVVAVITAILFVWRERRATDPLMSFGLLRRHPNYLAATASQGLAGMAEMGLGVIFPLVLILNLGMPPAKAGLFLIPTTIPMVILRRWSAAGMTASGDGRQ